MMRRSQFVEIIKKITKYLACKVEPSISNLENNYFLLTIMNS